MAAGGVFVKVKKSEWLITKYPDAPHYSQEDISGQIVNFLCNNYEYDHEGASELVEWGWQSTDDSIFLEKVKQQYLSSGLFTKEHMPD